MAAQRRESRPSPVKGGNDKKNGNKVPPRIYSCDLHELQKNPCGVRSVPRPGKYKGHHGHSVGRAGSNPPKPAHPHKDAVKRRKPHRPAVAREGIDASWFNETNPSRTVDRSTRKKVDHALAAWNYASAEGREALAARTGVRERAALEAGCRGPELLRAWVQDWIASLPATHEEVKVRQQKTQQPRPPQQRPVQPQPLPRAPVQAPQPVHRLVHREVPKRDRGALARALEEALRASGVDVVTRRGWRKIMRDSYGVLITVE